MPERVEPPTGQEGAVVGEVCHTPTCCRGGVHGSLDGCSIVVLPVSARAKVVHAVDLLLSAGSSLWQGRHHGGEMEAGEHGQRMGTVTISGTARGAARRPRAAARKGGWLHFHPR